MNLHESQPIFLDSSKAEPTIWEFNHDTHGNGAIDAATWGGCELVFPQADFDRMFDLIYTDKELTAARNKGLWSYRITEVSDGGDCDSITLIASDENGDESFRQRIVFYDLPAAQKAA